MNFVAPSFKTDAFHCPCCGTFAHMEWELLHTDNHGASLYHEAFCSRCEKSSIWRVTDFVVHQFGRNDRSAEMLLPDQGNAPLPDHDMPADVRADYIEAARIFSNSPRGAAALLRLGLQKLCKHLGQEGKNINTDIRNLSAENILPPMVVKVADTVRITGNNAVHPGEMSDEDFDHVASKMFDLLNFIVKKGISEPAELKTLYQMTPEAPRKAAERQDGRSDEGDT